MPFINLDHLIAKQILEEENPQVLKTLLYDGKINLREFEFLRVLTILTHRLESDDELTQQSQNELHELCNKYFAEEAERSYRRLINFSKTKENVSWVLFSRTCQFIPWEEKNPLEGYVPRLNPIKKVIINEIVEFLEE